ncbi:MULTISPECIES: carbonic anhydrase [Bacillus]|uniref:carbonic anhydrase n=1 Tax=Bacillus TaxID=1386 RepID=UPI00049B35E1|nr:carbonic anhydrase [Bacillus subtilis]AIC96829.1 carbonic anhydrase [Bacillus subtilis subsp. subtilis str. OH 131.1]AOA52839.1 Carbonate dehydratase [Bacillus subtilis]MCY8985458.1 carbonic anhydrase [Bacillus subtilis]MDR4183925.1 carbonic anhydrase [Bacillus subtilis]MEC1807816.1 carbonic anhydrase [Bacillus subtilis]
MNVNQNKKVLFLTDIENGLEPILQEATNTSAENMLTIQSYGSSISHPYGEIMRSVIFAIYQEDVEEIFVVGTKDKKTSAGNGLTQLETMKDKIQTLDYLFQNCKPEFFGGTVDEWLNENSSDTIEKSVDMIRHHPLVPSHVKVRGLLVNHKDGKPSIMEGPDAKTGQAIPEHCLSR